MWIGTSIENQESANKRIPELLKIPAAVRFLSCEPLLGPIDLTRIPTKLGGVYDDCLGGTSNGHDGVFCGCEFLHWVIAGGESGRNARPCHPDWIRSLSNQCVAAHVAFFFKQWGEWAPFASMDVSEFPDAPETTPICLVKSDGRAIRPYSYVDRPGQQMARVGKRSAGRLLDGREWNDIPKSCR